MHFVSGSCEGEKCRCGQYATHKAAEVIQWDDPQPARHELTAYLCCDCFKAVFGVCGQ